ncbi:MAG: hypothetical protein J6M18_04865 [Actinomycetaceae bacterium]|nr:hypothetical protein [Actinomycetaceae bacterium]
MKQKYTLRSGVSLEWSEAIVYKKDRQWIVDVPLVSGVDLVSKVLFVWNGRTVNIQEVYAYMESEQSVHVYVWNNYSYSGYFNC